MTVVIHITRIVKLDKMVRVLLIWDVKTRGSPATRFYRDLSGYDYETKSGKSHTDGVLDELPGDGWEFVSRSALVVEERYESKVVKVFKDNSAHVEWKRYRIVVRG